LTWIFSSLHISSGMTIVAVVVGEYLGASRGIGYLIAQAEGVFDTTGVFAGWWFWRRGSGRRSAHRSTGASTPSLET
jgi:hypothetical protein